MSRTRCAILIFSPLMVAACIAPRAMPVRPTTVQSGTGQSQHLYPEAIRSARNSVLRVCVLVKTDSGQALQVIGTAFVVDSGGIVATARHVTDLPPGTPLYVLPWNRDQLKLKTDVLNVLKQDTEHDLAIGRAVVADSLTPLPLADGQNLEDGDDALVLGFPFGNPSLTASRAMIAAHLEMVLEGAKKPTKMIKIDAAVNKGNSGGPLIDVSSGVVVGIINAREGALSEQLRFASSTRNTADMCNGGVCVIATIRETISELDKYLHVGMGYAVSVEYLSSLLAATK